LNEKIVEENFFGISNGTKNFSRYESLNNSNLIFESQLIYLTKDQSWMNYFSREGKCCLFCALTKKFILRSMCFQKNMKLLYVWKKKIKNLESHYDQMFGWIAEWVITKITRIVEFGISRVKRHQG